MATVDEIELARIRAEGGSEELVVDLRGGTFLDAGGARMLERARERARADGRVVMAVPSRQARRTLELLGLVPGPLGAQALIPAPGG